MSIEDTLNYFWFCLLKHQETDKITQMECIYRWKEVLLDDNFGSDV